MSYDNETDENETPARAMLPAATAPTTPSDEWAAAKAAFLDAPIRDPRAPAQAATLRQLWIASQILNSSGIFRTGFGDSARQITDREALVICIVGAKLGLDPIGSLMGFDLIEGRPAARVATLHAIVMSTGTVERLERTASTAELATWVGARRTPSGAVLEQEVTFTLEDARGAELLNKKNWKRWVPDMLSARALSRVLRLLWPDVLSGVTSTEEASDGVSSEEREADVLSRMIARTTPSAEVVDPPPEPAQRTPSGPPVIEAPRELREFVAPLAAEREEVAAARSVRQEPLSWASETHHEPPPARTRSVGVRRGSRGGES